MTNLLQNPNMRNWQHDRYFTDREGRGGTIEVPQGWEFAAAPKLDDPDRIPQSLHRDNGFVISVAYIPWEAGYVQRSVQLEANQRYLAKAVYKPDVNFPGGQQADLTAITWRFVITSSAGEEIAQDWQVTGKGQYKQDEENLYVFQTASAVSIDYAFMVRSVYGSNSCDMWVYELALEPVSADFGGPNVPIIGKAAVVETIPEPEPLPESTPSKPEIVEDVPVVTANISGTSGKSLGDVLSDEDIDQIAEGLRALASESGVKAAMGLHKLAEGLERLKA